MTGIDILPYISITVKLSKMFFTEIYSLDSQVNRQTLFIEIFATESKDIDRNVDPWVKSKLSELDTTIITNPGDA